MTLTCGLIALTIEHPATVHWSRMAGKLACWGLEAQSNGGSLRFILASDGATHRWVIGFTRAELDSLHDNVEDLLIDRRQWAEYFSDLVGSPIGWIRRGT